MLAIDLSYAIFIMLRYVSSIPSFFEALIMKERQTSPEGFAVSEMTVWFLPLGLCSVLYLLMNVEFDFAIPMLI